MSNENESTGLFSDLPIAPGLLKQIERLKLEHPTPIQQKTIPIALRGQDVIGIAQTGTGKTFAFSIPMIQQLSDGVHTGLVLLPTRELALQVEEEIIKLGRYFGIKTVVLIGGASMNEQIKKLRRNPNVIIATPGRLIDHLHQHTVSLDRVRFLVLDEADRMLDMGFEPQIKQVLSAVPTNRQTFLFSATMPERISQIARKYMRQPTHIEVAPSGTTVELVVQEAYFVQMQEKFSLLEQILKTSEGSVLVFTRTKHGAKKVTRNLLHSGFKAAEIHSNRSLNQRKEALQGFKSGKYRVLVATDIASRGIDVVGIQLVVNYDMPNQLEDYVHRIGRTARAGRAGKAVLFVVPDQKKELAGIERLIKMRLQVKPLPQGVVAVQTRGMQGQRRDVQTRLPERSNDRFERSNRVSSGFGRPGFGHSSSGRPRSQRPRLAGASSRRKGRGGGGSRGAKQYYYSE